MGQYENMIIAGCRWFHDDKLFSEIIYNDFHGRNDIIIVTGRGGVWDKDLKKRLGVDWCAERYATENHIPLRIFEADWNQFGSGAGPIRNEDMVRIADSAIFLWDRQSRGTSNCIKLCKDYRVPYKIYDIKTP